MMTNLMLTLTYKIYLDPVAQREAFKGGEFDMQLINSSRDWALDYKGDFVKKGDNIEKVFDDYMKKNNLKYDKKYIQKILKESSKTILQLKYYYNRPRPKQIADYYGMKEFKNVNLPRT